MLKLGCECQDNTTDQFLLLRICKRYMIAPQLLWNANRKPYQSFQMVPFSMSLSDLKPRFQRHKVTRDAIVLYCVQLLSDLIAIAKFLVATVHIRWHAQVKTLEVSSDTVTASVNSNLFTCSLCVVSV